VVGGGEAQRRALAWAVCCHSLSVMTTNFVRRTLLAESKDVTQCVKETCPLPWEAAEGLEGILFVTLFDIA
jgi:hypothetical protein